MSLKIIAKATKLRKSARMPASFKMALIGWFDFKVIFGLTELERQLPGAVVIIWQFGAC